MTLLTKCGKSTSSQNKNHSTTCFVFCVGSVQMFNGISRPEIFSSSLVSVIIMSIKFQETNKYITYCFVLYDSMELNTMISMILQLVAKIILSFLISCIVISNAFFLLTNAIGILYSFQNCILWSPCIRA